MAAYTDGSNRGRGYLPFDKTDLEQAVCIRFEEQVYKFPDRIAIRTRHVTLTYRALNQEANRIARAIVDRCGTAQEQVAHLVTDDAKGIAATLGILKAGKIFVALDPCQPQVRNLQLLNHAEARLVVTDGENLEVARALAGGREPLNIDAISSGVSDENLGLAILPDALAGILYTSGSTGQPKGVLQNQRNLLLWGLSYGYGLRISPSDRLCMVAARTSGQSLVIMLAALFHGASACPFRLREEGPGALSSWLIDQEITIYHSSASIFRSFVQTFSGRERFPHLRALRLGGEIISTKDFELYKKHFPPQCMFVTSLGATEVGPFREFFADHNTAISGDVMPSGFPAWGWELLLLDDAARTVEPGCVGEIAVRSDYLAVSYWRQPELTSAAFQPDPTGSSSRIYRTGDLGRLSPDGCLYLLGRKDRQVKIRGNRVELEEIERALRKIDGVQDAVLTVRRNNQGEPFLVAYFVAATRPAPSTHSLRTALRNLLPEYMVPRLFVMLDSFPTTSHGKVDREALPEPRLKRSYVPPRNAVETLLCELWEQILGVRPVGIRDDFLELGGNSLLAARLMTHIELHFNRPIPRSTWLSATTVEELAKVIPGKRDQELVSPLVRMQAGGSSRTPFFFLHGQFNGWGLYCKVLGPLLSQEQPFYVLHPLPANDDLPATVELMAKRYLRVLRRAQPHGPYLLGGYCNAGLVALEMAQELAAQGEKVELLVLIETVARNHEFRVHRKLVSLAARLLKVSPAHELHFFLRICGLWTDFRGLSVAAKAELLAGTARGVGKRLSRLFWRSLWLNAARSLPSNGWEQERVNAHYKRLVFGYVPRPYAGRVTIFRARDQKQLIDDPALGWRGLARDVDIHVVPGDHNGCIQLAENLPVLAEHLKACLDRFHAASHPEQKEEELLRG